MPPHFNQMDRIDYQQRRNDLLNYIHQVISPTEPHLEKIYNDLKRESRPNEKLLLNYLILEFRPYELTKKEDDDVREVIDEFMLSLDQRLTPQSLSKIQDILNDGKTDDQNREA